MRPILLDLFCGAGGAAMGYHRAGFDVIGVDINPQPHYPFEFHQADSFVYLENADLSRFAAIHASPPCQAYTRMRNITLARFGKVNINHPDLIAATRSALIATGKPYIIENVTGSPLHTQIVICGASIGLPHMARHRHFECSILLPAPPPCQHYRESYTIGIYGSKPDGHRVSYRQNRLCRVANSIEEARDLMGIDWMDWDEIKNAIPPAYTEWIGNQLLQFVIGGESRRRKSA